VTHHQIRRRLWILKVKSVNGSIVPLLSWLLQFVPFTRSERSSFQFSCSCTNRSEKCEILLFVLCSVCTTFDDAWCVYSWVCTRNYLFNVTFIKIVIIQKCLKWQEQTYISPSLQGWLRLWSGTWWSMSFPSWIVARRNTTVGTKEHLGITITLPSVFCWNLEGVCGSEDVAPLFLNLGTRWGGKSVLPLSKDPPGTRWIGSWVNIIACLDA
jgi:hypothetical protein